jgi:hypothetical protein
MATFYFDISHNSSNILPSTQQYYDRHTWAGAQGSLLTLTDNGGNQLLQGYVPILLGGEAPADAFLKVFCAVNSFSTSDLAFEFNYENVGAGEDVDNTTWMEEFTDVTVAGSGDNLTLLVASLDLAHANFADGDICKYEFGMDGPNNDVGTTIYVYSAFVQIET